MKHTKLLLSIPVLLTPVSLAPILSSCNNNKEQLETKVYYKNESHLKTKISLPTIYKDTAFSFEFELDTNCHINFESSYIKIGEIPSLGFLSHFVHLEKTDNKIKVSVDQEVVKGEYVLIYLSTYKTYNLDTSGSSSDFTFVEELTPTIIEDERFTIGFKVAENKGIDFNKSTITIGSTVIPPSLFTAFEEEYNETTYAFISISSRLVKGDIKLSLIAGDTVETSIKSYPEYIVSSLSAPVLNNDYYLYLTLVNPDQYMFDEDNIKISVDGSELTTSDWELVEYDELTYLKINGDKITGTIDIDVPVIRYYSVYACKDTEKPTCVVVGDEIIPSTEYKFKVYALHSKEILWDDTNTYIEVDNQEHTKLIKDTDFTAEQDSETKIWTITIAADKVQAADLYCHFITQ